MTTSRRRLRPRESRRRRGPEQRCCRRTWGAGSPARGEDLRTRRTRTGERQQRRRGHRDLSGRKAGAGKAGGRLWFRGCPGL